VPHAFRHFNFKHNAYTLDSSGRDFERGHFIRRPGVRDDTPGFVDRRSSIVQGAAHHGGHNRW
jgi:hypothetical protein